MCCYAAILADMHVTLTGGTEGVCGGDMACSAAGGGDEDSGNAVWREGVEVGGAGKKKGLNSKATEICIKTVSVFALGRPELAYCPSRALCLHVLRN